MEMLWLINVSETGNESMQCIGVIWGYKDVQLCIISIKIVIDMVMVHNVSKWEHIK